MSAGLLGAWLRHWDPIHLGMTARGIANGVFTSVGRGFLRVRGGYNLYRGRERAGEGGAGAGVVNYDEPVGAAGAGAERVRNFPWRGHGAGAVYVYVLRAVGGGGVEERNTEVVARVETDEAGGWRGLAANGVTNLRVRAMAGGRFLVCWSYCAKGEAARAAGFRVYTDGGSGTINYAAAVGTVEYRPGVADYSFGTAGYAHGMRVLFGVRSVTGAGVEESSEQIVMGVAMAAGPAAHGTVMAERGS